MLTQPFLVGLRARYGSFVLVALIGAFVSCASDPFERADAQMVEVHPGNFDRVYMQPELDMPRLNRVAIEEPTVEMSEQWLRNFRGNYTEGDLARFREDYGRFLKEELSEALTQSNVEVVASPTDADMLLRPRLRNLNVYAPDLTRLPGRTDQYVETAGNATLDLAFVDPGSGRVLAQFLDHRQTPPLVAGQITETNRVTNNRIFRRLMARWSRNLVEYLRYEGALDRAG